VVLVFFVLMDASLLVFSLFVFSALHHRDEPILPWWRSQTSDLHCAVFQS
jgi:hypothetical protein